MSPNEYVEQLKKMIKVEVDRLSALNEFEISTSFGKIYPTIAQNIKAFAPHIGLPPIDDISLQSYFEIARKEFLSNYVSNINPGSSLNKNPEKISWLTDERETEIPWNYTERYLRYLERNGRSKPILDETRKSSFEIISKLGDPSDDEFYVKGLVVGEVQSGKTGNFNAVINRAVDAGYGLIIILSGIMEDLRSQTQKRIESDVIGEGIDDETGKKGVKGAGHIARFGHLGDSNVEQVVSITSAKSDFKKSLADADFSLNHKNILVCKKNVSVLKNLIVWLHEYLDKDKEKHNIPFLIIDDEADNASLNNEGSKGSQYASRVNLLIRTLLQLFHKKSYLGYTATPFANVLQDRNETSDSETILKYRDGAEAKEISVSQVDNIFPDNFIYLLNSPSNYVGAKKIFETVEVIDNEADGEKLPVIEIVDDYIPEFPTQVTDTSSPEGVRKYQTRNEWDERNGYSGDEFFSSHSEYRQLSRASRAGDDFPKNLPESLEEAVLCFILSIAIREKRKPEMMQSGLFQCHHTMLIHISRFTLWQNKTAELLVTYVELIKGKVENDSPTEENSIYFEFERLWYKYYASIIESVKKYLPSDYIDEFLTPMVFKSIITYLPSAVAEIEVKAINSVTKQKLIYEKHTPKKYIAVGGNRLSRGFTLEGLTINYFIRNTNYSDTLLQMGRWFGYRPGYIDCCKLFTTSDSIHKFNQTTKCIEELEHEFNKMSRKNSSPERFVIRVKKHPGALKITRPSMLRGAKELKWSYQDQLEMATLYDVSKVKIDKVWNQFTTNIAPKFTRADESRGFLTFEASGQEILEILKQDNNFLSDDVATMSKFISMCIETNKLTKWTVALKATGNAKDETGINKRLLTKDRSGLIKDIELSKRSGPRANSYRKNFLEDKKFYMTGKNANITGAAKDLAIRLDTDTIEKAEADYIEEKIKEIRLKDPSTTESEAKDSIKRIPEKVYRERMDESEALLVIYLFDSYYAFNQGYGDPEDQDFADYIAEEGIDLETPLVGYAIGFPPMENDPGGIYVKGDYDIEEDEMTEEQDDIDSSLPDDFDEGGVA
jgi:hypothetical protein